MWIKSLRVMGFMPFRDDTTIKFKKSLYGIVGEYEGEPGKSNRAGKSAITEAVLWNLYGKTRAKKDTELIHHGCDQCLVEVVYVEGENEYTVRRWRSSDNKGGLEIEGMEGSKKKEAQPLVEKMVGMTYQEFMLTTFFKQNDIDQFMEAEPQKKKEWLMNWIQLTNWAKYEEEAQEVKRDLQRELDELKFAYGELPDEFDPKSYQAMIDEKKAELVKHEGRAKNLSDKKIKYELELKDLDKVGEIEREMDRLRARLKKLQAERPDGEEINATIKTYQAELDELPEYTPEQVKKAAQTKHESVLELGKLTSEEQRLDREEKLMRKERTGTCPILNEPCDRIKVTPETIKKITDRRAQIDEARITLSRAVDKAEKVDVVARKAEKLRNGINGLKERIQVIKNYDEQIVEIKKQGIALKAKIPADIEEKRAELNEIIDGLKTESREVNQAVAALNRELGELEERIRNGLKAVEKKKGYKLRIEELEEKVADATYVAFMFGKNGIPSVELENSFAEIERDANFILDKMGAPFTLEFSSMRELGDWEPNCLACGTVYEKGTKTHKCKKCGTDRAKKKKDELSVRVFENGEEKAFYMDSGGGKIMLSAAIRIALTLLARRKTGTNWNTLFLDELFGQLDPVNRKNMAELITTTLKDDLGFDQIFIISHDKEIQSATSKTLTIFRNKKGYSTPILQ